LAARARRARADNAADTIEPSFMCYVTS